MKRTLPVVLAALSMVLLFVASPLKSVAATPANGVSVQSEYAAFNSCPSAVNITLRGDSCWTKLTFASLGLNSSDSSGRKIIVSDNKPSNFDTIDCAGTWTYGIFDANNQLICWGTVNAEDKSGPLLHLLVKGRNEDRGNRTWSKDTVLFNELPNGVDYDTSFGNINAGAPIPAWEDSMMCTTVLDVYNNPKSWTDASYAYYTGAPTFLDACHNHALCDCQTTLKATDVLTYYTCNDITNGLWAKVVRTFTATDCRGNVSTVVQEIYFRRPMLVDAGFSGNTNSSGQASQYASAAGIVTGDSSNTPHPIQFDSVVCQSYTAASLIDLLKKGQYPDTSQFGTVQPKYIFADTLSNTVGDRYSYFAEALASGTGNYNKDQSFGNLDNGAGDGGVAGTVVKRLECNYSFDVEKVSEFPVCNGGIKVLVVVTAFDWCTGVRHELDYLMLKATDDSKPRFAKPTKPVVISTGATDCTASVGIDHQSLIDYFGLTVTDFGQTDTCKTNPNVNVTIETCEYPTSYGIITGASTFNTTNYRTMQMTVGGKSRLMVLGLPVGRHRLTVKAQDGCYNKDSTTLDFVVVDKVAPVMKCTDNLNVTLTNTQSGAYGQDLPDYGYDIKGYAKVLVSEINAGSWDNCAMDWVRVRRSVPADQASFKAAIAVAYDPTQYSLSTPIKKGDWIDWNKDGDHTDDLETFDNSKVNGTLMTPALDYVEFFCSDQGDNGVMVELWGKDKTTTLVTCSPALSAVGGVNYPTTSGGNLNYCWQVVHLEDKVYPTFVAPWPATISCKDRAWLDSLSTARTVNYTSSTYQFIETNIFEAQNKGEFRVMSGDDCGNLNVTVKIEPTLVCDSGSVKLTFTATKNIGGVATTFAAGTTTIAVKGVHEYNLQFPGDVSGNCEDVRDTANVIDGGELSCDVLAVNVTDKRYNGATVGGAPVAECYKIFRTFTVINWCQYDERCGEPMQWAVIVPRDPDNKGGYDGVNVLVRDELDERVSPAITGSDGVEEIYFEDAKKNLTVDESRVISFSHNNTVGGASGSPCSYRSDEFAWMFTQHIIVHDNTKPVIADQTVAPFVQNKNSCLGPVSITITATDDCAATEVQNANSNATGNLAIERIQLKLNGGAAATVAAAKVTLSHLLNGDAKGTGSWTYADNLPLGNHSLIVIVRDDCGNLSLQKEIPFSVVDNDPIAPICYHGLSTDLMYNPDKGTGEMAVWASDFVASDVYDCNGQGPATDPGNANHEVITKYYVVKDVNGDGAWTTADGLKVDAKSGNLIPTTPSTSVVFTCADLGGETEATVLVRLYSLDEQANWGWCETYANITDARGVCAGPGAAAAAVAGAITTEGSLSVEGVEVSLSGDATMNYATNVNGQFSFTGLKQGYDYTVTPQLDKNYLNGVSTFDLVLITKHILGVQPLASPYKLIAADVNNSKSVTTLDLIQLRKLILNIDTKFANNTSWRFVDASYKFANAANPWAAQFPEVVNLNDVAADVRANFVAIKIGDVNGNAVASSQVRTAGTFGLNVAEQALKAGNEYSIAFSGDLSQVDGYQFTLGLDLNAVELVNVEAGVAKEENFGIFAKEGVITASWNGEANSSNLFTLVVRAKADANLSEVISLNSRYTAAEAYNKGGEQLNVALHFTGSQPVAAGFDLKQNTPNPFAGETVVGFTLPVAGDATLTVQDVTGRTLRVVKGTYAQGYNQVTLKANELKATGVLYYTLESGEFTATRKMVIIE